MKWFVWWKRRDRARRVPVDASDTRFWSAVKVVIEKRSRKVACYLDRKTLYWNRGSKLIALAVFCLVFGSVCLWLLMRAFGWLR